MNYSGLSDDKINLHVFERLFGNIGEDRDMLRVWQQGKFQPCNSWVDAGPIIFKHGISIMKDSGLHLWCATSKAYWVDGSEWQMGQEEMDANPLRAAMIVFLMMQESK